MWGFRFNPCTKGHPVGMVEMQSGSVKILKHLATLSFQVIDGSNVISLSIFLAILFLACHLFVSERLLCCSPIWSGLYFGTNSWILVRASFAHAWGLGIHLFCPGYSCSSHMLVRGCVLYLVAGSVVFC